MKKAFLIVLTALFCTMVMSACAWADEVEPPVSKTPIYLNIADGSIQIGYIFGDYYSVGGGERMPYNKENEYFLISGKSTRNNIELLTVTGVDITLDNVSIELDDNKSALDLFFSSATVTLEGNNKLVSRGGVNAAGIRVRPTYTLTIKGSPGDGFDFLEARGGGGSAGIGGISTTSGLLTDHDAGTIIIQDCMIVAVGSSGAAGIGGASEGHGGKINISGSIVDATGGRRAAGIGDGSHTGSQPEKKAKITITKSIVEASTSFSNSGPAILGKSISIINSLVDAYAINFTSGDINAGIDCDTITIEGVLVTAVGKPALLPEEITLTGDHLVWANEEGSYPGAGDDPTEVNSGTYNNDTKNRFVRFMSKAPEEDPFLPPRITGAQATSSRSVTLTFSESESEGVDGYFVWCENTDAMAMVKSGSTNFITTTITGLAPATTYSFRVAAYTADDISPPSNAYVVTTPESDSGGGCDAGFGAMALLLIAVPCAARMSKKKR